MATLNQAVLPSDSEDDDDYVPQQDESDSENQASSPKRARTSPDPTETDPAERKKARDALWASFQASVSAADSASPRPDEQPKKTVKIQKTYRFAGEDVTQVLEVPEDSDDARKWPLWQPGGPSSSSSSRPTESKDAASTSAAPDAPSSAGPSKVRPGPRKPKTSLATLPNIPTRKPKKLTTLDKSAMDWHAHVSTEADSGLKDELEANRRGGGYLEKVDFMERVNARKEEVLQAVKGRKRGRI